jgi:rhodanese-related sulfurtransferase
MTTAITLELPPAAYEQLRRTASRQNRPVAEVVKDIVLREIPDLPALPADVEAELATFSQLSNDVLWLIARSTLTRQQQDELAHLNDQAQRRPLTADEQSQQEKLISVYDRVLVRRAQAALVLKQRGYDLTNPVVLQTL